MSVGDILAEKHILPALRVSSKKQCFRELARLAADFAPVDERQILSLLLEREMLGSTGTGHGVAIPHARIKGLEKPMGFFARLKEPIDFESSDGEPVDLVFLLLAPTLGGSVHLKSLSKVSRALRNPEIRERLRQADGKDEIYHILTTERSGPAPKLRQQFADSRQMTA